MNWKPLRALPFLDTRARFLASIPKGARLLDAGSSDGETLKHFHEMRPDLQLFATDIAGNPNSYPEDCIYHQADLNKDNLPWEDHFFEAISCMHLIEHLDHIDPFLSEVARLLKPGGRAYFETPHPKTLTLSSEKGKGIGSFTINFYDDLTHTKIITLGALAQKLRRFGLDISRSGISRNWLFALAYPFFFFMPSSRKRLTSKIHWIGWSAYLIAEKFEKFEKEDAHL